MRITLTCCSDLHWGPPGDPATDATAGWPEAWARVPPPKLRLGDMDELLQFDLDEIAGGVGTDLEGNHDRWRGPAMVRMGDTVFLHGHQFDPWWFRLVERPLARLGRWVERLWPDADVALDAKVKRLFRIGRHGGGRRDYYIRKAVRLAKRLGARQIVFGHLHECWCAERDGVRVVCTGCCVGGRLDFVPVTVELNAEDAEGRGDKTHGHEGKKVRIREAAPCDHPHALT